MKNIIDDSSEQNNSIDSSDDQDHCIMCDGIANKKYANICPTCDPDESFYCDECIQKCTICQNYCCVEHCWNDNQNFLELETVTHDCIVDGKITCQEYGKGYNSYYNHKKGEKAQCALRYCLNCITNCSKCEHYLIQSNKKICNVCCFESNR